MAGRRKRPERCGNTPNQLPQKCLTGGRCPILFLRRPEQGTPYGELRGCPGSGAGLRRPRGVPVRSASRASLGPDYREEQAGTARLPMDWQTDGPFSVPKARSGSSAAEKAVPRGESASPVPIAHFDDTTRKSARRAKSGRFIATPAHAPDFLHAYMVLGSYRKEHIGVFGLPSAYGLGSVSGAEQGRTGPGIRRLLRSRCLE